MGYTPRAWSLTPEQGGKNHLLLAEAAGLGSADLDAIDLRGLTLAEALHSF